LYQYLAERLVNIRGVNREMFGCAKYVNNLDAVDGDLFLGGI
jgi:hypothetical protein